MTSYRSPLLARPGAVEADPPDAGVAAHYGDPLREQRQLEAGQGWVDLSHRPVLRVAGPDRLGWLHTLTTQHLQALPSHVARTALVLSPHGHVEHALYLVDDGTATWLHVEPGTADALRAYLVAMRFWSDVDIADVSGEWALVWHPETAAETGAADSAAAVAGPGTSAPAAPRPPVRELPYGREVFLPRDALAGYVDRAGPPAGMWAAEALRIAARRPRLGRETDHRTIPHELGWLDEAVHLHKGCYRGQETVARVHNLGRPPRRLVLLHLDGSVERLPAHGDPVELAGRRVGFVTSAARHHELGPVALALVKRNTAVEATLDAAGIPGTQEVAVPAG